MKKLALVVSLGAGLFPVGCALHATSGANNDEVNDVQVALSVVPAGVQCVRVAVTTGGTTLTPPLLTVTPGASSASLNVGQLPAGSATFNGSAFNVPCAMVTASTVATWIATPVTTTLVTGLNNQVTLVFLSNNAVGVNANFLAAPVEVGVGSVSSRVRLSDGTVREWGESIAGALENPPGQALGVSDAVQLGTGGQNAACQRTSAGNVTCAGSLLLLGVPPGTFTFTAVTLSFPTSSALSPITQVALGVGHGCALQRLSVSCWGDNSQGQFGNGTATSSGAPVATGVTAAKIFPGALNTCFLQGDGSLTCTGINGNGQLGNNTTTSSLAPVSVVGLSDTLEAAVGTAHACALRADGTVRCWGSNAFGQLGDGTTTQRLTPVQVLNITDATHVVAGANHTCVLRQTGAVSCWGKGSALGDGIGANRATPQDIAGLSGVVALDSHLGNHSCVITSDRSLKCWGENSVGQVDGSFVFAGKPVTVALQ